MSDKGIDACVEKLLADPEYAKRALKEPEQTLTADHDLDPGEWRSIHWALKQDVEDSLGDVTGHSIASINFTAVNFNYLRQLPTLKGSIDRMGTAATHGVIRARAARTRKKATRRHRS